MKVGRKPDPRRVYLQETFGLTDGQIHHFDNAFIEQLCKCADDDARRLLLFDGKVSSTL